MQKQTRNRKPMQINCHLTNHGKTQSQLFKGHIGELVQYLAKHDGAEYNQIAKALDTGRQTIACRVAYLVQGGYVKTDKQSGKIKKKGVLK